MAENKEKKTMVSRKQILPFIEALKPVVEQMKEKINAMPNCSKKTSLFVTLAAFEKKVTLVTKEINEEQAAAYVKAHPEVMQKYANMARTDENMKKAMLEATKDLNVDEVKPEEHNKSEGRKKRF
jgi:hypothetical protein